MSQLPHKFIKGVVSLSPVNLRLQNGDDFTLILNKIQGQIDAIREAAMGGSYNSVAYLDDQTSSGTVLVFTFPVTVEKVWVEFNLPSDPDSTATGRLRGDLTDPDADTGTLLHAGQVQPISLQTAEVRVLVPSGYVVSMYGYYNA